MKASEFRVLFDRATSDWPDDDRAMLETDIRRDWPDAEKRKAWIGTVQQIVDLQ